MKCVSPSRIAFFLLLTRSISQAHAAIAKDHIFILTHFDPRMQSCSPASLENVPSRRVAHRSTASTLARTPDLSPIVEPVEATYDEAGRVCVPIVRFTATFERADGRALGKVFETIAWHVDLVDMMKAGW